ncbi:MAG: hypothetical protein HKO71_07110 [Pseudomonadales bacterium]|nr:hypothetical protein [Gammaproteobacteria bacterium]NNL57505.1 hypothetical protein [Pseudomonadales bacterium]
MSTKPLPSAKLENPATAGESSAEHSARIAVQQRFYLQNGAWFVKHNDQQAAGPFADKADAQMAMLYFSARAFWPNEKQLREFARSGK